MVSQKLTLILNKINYINEKYNIEKFRPVPN